MDNFILTKHYTEPSNTYNLVSVVLFKLSVEYKSFEKYLNGLQLFVDNFETHFPNFYLRIYYDDSIATSNIEVTDTDISNRFIDIIGDTSERKFIQLVHFQHPWFLSMTDSKHIGLFGTIVRLLPFFNSDNTNIVLSAEVDISENFFTLYKNMYVDFQLSDAKLLFMTRQCYHLRPRYIDVSRYLKIHFVPYIGTMWIRGKLPVDLLNDFLHCIHQEKLSGECQYIGVFVENQHKNTSRGTVNSEQPLIERMLHFGIDEVFAANLIAYVVKNKIPYMIDLLPHLAFVLDDLYDNSNGVINKPEHTDLIKRIMQNKYDSKKSPIENYNIMKKSLLFNYTFKPKNKHDRFIIRNTIRELMLLLKNTAYKKLGFDEYNFMCIRHSYDIFSVVVLLCDGYECKIIKKY